MRKEDSNAPGAIPEKQATQPDNNVPAGAVLSVTADLPSALAVSPALVLQSLENSDRRDESVMLADRLNLKFDVAAALADPQVVVFLVFPSGHDIRLDLLDRARRSVPTLEYGRVCALREIVGPEWWDTLPKRHRITGGETFANLVGQGVFDLEFACHPERSNKIYRRL